MNWGRKKPEPSSSSIIGRVFPVSWINKFKKRVANHETNSVKENHRDKVDFPTPNSSLPPCWKEGRVYTMDEDDAYWRLSFAGEKIEGRRSTGGLMNPLWYDSDDDSQAPVSSFKSLRFRATEVPRSEERWNFNDMVLDIKKMKAMEQKGSGENDQRLRKPTRGGLGVIDAEPGRRQDEEQKDIFEIAQNMVQAEEQFPESAVSNSKKQQQHTISFPNWGLSSIEEDCAFEGVSTSERQNFDDIKIEKIKMNESQEKSANISRGSHGKKTKQNNKVKVYSPRTECKIRALEEMKKSRMKLKKKVAKQQVVEGATMFDRFAVLKSSFNPQQDFRDSMVEMILTKEIRQTEELEELLACYLTFNCDEYHDLIIKVFRQVWFELNRGMGIC